MIKGNKMNCVSYKVNEEHLIEYGMAMRGKQVLTYSMLLYNLIQYLVKIL